MAALLQTVLLQHDQNEKGNKLILLERKLMIARYLVINKVTYPSGALEHEYALTMSEATMLFAFDRSL